MSEIKEIYSCEHEGELFHIRSTIRVNESDFINTKTIMYSHALAVFKFIFNKYYIDRNRKESCDCMDGAYDNCEVCCPDSYKNYIFRDELEQPHQQ